MKQRTITGACILAFIALMLASRLLTLYVFDIFVGVLMIVASIETSRILNRMNYSNHMVVMGIFPSLAYLGIMLGFMYNLPLWSLYLIEIGVAILLCVISFIISLFCKKYAIADMKSNGHNQLNSTPKWKTYELRKSACSMIGMIYPAIMLSFLIFSNRIVDLSVNFKNGNVISNADFGMFILAISFIIPIISDTFAYLSGMLLKGPKLCPKISPKKTIAGAVGGLCWTVIVMMCIYFIVSAIPSFSVVLNNMGFGLTHFAALGLAGSFASQVGDLIESTLKRKARMKDSGNWLPGHGGLMDRFDSHIISAPIVFIYFICFLI